MTLGAAFEAEALVAGLDPAFLSPVASSQPTEAIADHARIAEARRDEDASLPQGVWVRDVKQADWALVERLCTESLVTRAKDLRIACWLCEAWVQRHGFAGLHRGLLLLEGLSCNFWPNMYPALENGDLSGRIAPFEWLMQRLPVTLRLVPIAFDAAQPHIRLSWWELLEAQRLESIRGHDPRAAKRAESDGRMTLATFSACQARTAGSWLVEQSVSLDAALTVLARLDRTLDEYCGTDAPGLGRIRTLAIDIKGFIDAELSRRAISAAPEMLPEPKIAATVSVTSPPPRDVKLSAAMTRPAAYAALAEIASFLHANEPHSPVPHMLDYLVEWGTLSLAEIAAGLEAAGGDLGMLLAALGTQQSLNNAEFS